MSGEATIKSYVLKKIREIPIKNPTRDEIELELDQSLWEIVEDLRKRGPINIRSSLRTEILMEALESRNNVVNDYVEEVRGRVNTRTFDYDDVNDESSDSDEDEECEDYDAYSKYTRWQ